MGAGGRIRAPALRGRLQVVAGGEQLPFECDLVIQETHVVREVATLIRRTRAVHVKTDDAVLALNFQPYSLRVPCVEPRHAIESRAHASSIGRPGPPFQLSRAIDVQLNRTTGAKRQT